MSGLEESDLFHFYRFHTSELADGFFYLIRAVAALVIHNGDNDQGLQAKRYGHLFDRTPLEAGMRLLHLPKKPAYLPAITVKMDTRNMPSEWVPYWTTALDP